MYGTTRSVCTRWGARSSQGYQAAMQIFLETFICLGGKCLLRVSALFKDKATWPGIKHELCDLLKSMQYANWRWIILNWHATFSRHVVSSTFWGSFYRILVSITFCGSCYILDHNNGHFDSQVEEIQPLVVLSMVQKILSAMWALGEVLPLNCWRVILFNHSVSSCLVNIFIFFYLKKKIIIAVQYN